MNSLRELGASTSDAEFASFASPLARERLRAGLELVSAYHGFVFASARGTVDDAGNASRKFVAGCYELPHIVTVADTRERALNQLLDLSLDAVVTRQGALFPRPLEDGSVPRECPGQTATEWLAARVGEGKLSPLNLSHSDGLARYCAEVRAVIQSETPLPSVALLVECYLQSLDGYRRWTLSRPVSISSGRPSA